MTLNIYQKICLSLLFALVAFWIILFLSGSKEGLSNFLYSFFLGFIPLFGGIVAMRGWRIWGGFGNALGKAVFFLGLGLLLFGCGETVWSYYNIILNVESPYPSFADLFFAPSVFFYATGAIYLAQTTGVGLGLKSWFGKVFAVLSPVIILFISYYLLVVVGRGGVLFSEGSLNLKTILDFAYPFGDFVALTVSVLVSGLSFKYLGGAYKFDIISILIGLAVMFIADSLFSYLTIIGTSYNGDVNDLVYVIGLFLISFGVLGFCKLKNQPVEAARGSYMKVSA